MPAKTIYVKAEHLEIFDQAEIIAALNDKSLSRLIADLLTEYVEQNQETLKAIRLWAAKLGE